jgi:hypothetical protein
MAESTTPINEADLQAFLEMAGRSLTDAQGTLSTGVDVKSDLVIANAELEAKVALKADSGGRLSVEPVSLRELQRISANAAGLSTVRVNFVATAREATPGVAFTRPARQPSEVVAEVRQRQDVSNLESILGALKIETVFEPRTQRWVVTAHDARNRLVREMILPDEPG